MKPPVLIAAPFLERTLAPLRKDFELIESGGDPLGAIASCSRAHEIRVIASIGNAPVSRALIELLPALEFICHYGAGYEKLDLAAARERHVKVANTPGTNSSCVADLAAALLIGSIRRVVEADQRLRAGEWPKDPIRFLFSSGLAGRKVGIYGLGAIGLKAANRLSAFEMHIGYHNRSARTDVEYSYFGSLEALVDWADDLVVAVAATKENHGIVDRAIFERLGTQGHFVNVARGSVVDEEALIGALRDGVIAGAGLDVYADEPRVPDALIAMNNVILAPHMASKTDNAISNLDSAFQSNLRRFFRGEPVYSIIA
jgi:lactate dehydrogenase-like 2-hydroxyacid dehydrogenase